MSAQTLIVLLGLDRTWMRRAACRDIDNPDLFFPEQGDTRSAALAKLICASCPVQTECRDYAIDVAEKHGIWGGTTNRERRAVRMSRRAA